MSKFTAGPWVAECVACGGDYSNPIDVYEVNNGYSRICEHCIENDARLIAAAPELLESLEKAQTVLRQQSIHVDPCTGESVSPLMREIDAAIKKARGE